MSDLAIICVLVWGQSGPDWSTQQTLAADLTVATAASNQSVIVTVVVLGQKFELFTLISEQLSWWCVSPLLSFIAVENAIIL